MNKKMPQFTRYYSLDALRFIFCIIIILYHFIRKMGFWATGAGYAVEFFFILSGFLCAKTFNTNLSVGAFLRRKLLRIYPLLVTAVIILIPVKPMSVTAIINTLFLVPAWNNDLAIFIAWYINVWFWISLFYFYLMKTIQPPIRNLIIGLSVWIACYIMISKNIWLTWEKVGNIWNAGLLRGIAAMGAGYMLSQTRISANTSISPLKRIGITGLEAITLIYTIVAMFIKSWYINPFCLFLSQLMLIFLFIQNKGYLSFLLNHPFFKKLGAIALPTYLLQQTTVELFARIYQQNKPLIDFYPYTTMIIIVGIALFIGLLGYCFIQVPFQKYADKSSVSDQKFTLPKHRISHFR